MEMTMDFEKHPLYDWLSEIRRDFHMHPEPSFEEHRTTARIKAILAELGVEVRATPALATGAVGVGQPAETETVTCACTAAPPLRRASSV